MLDFSQPLLCLSSALIALRIASLLEVKLVELGSIVARKIKRFLHSRTDELSSGKVTEVSHVSVSKKAWSGDGRSGQRSDMADVVCQRLRGVVEYGRNEGGKREWRERSSRLIERDIALHGSFVVGQESEEVVDVGSERGSTGEKSRVIGGGEDGIC